MSSTISALSALKALGRFRVIFLSECVASKLTGDCRSSGLSAGISCGKSSQVFKRTSAPDEEGGAELDEEDEEKCLETICRR